MLTTNQLYIFSILAENPEKEYYLSEVGKLIGKKPGVFQKGINAMEREGWVLSHRRGNQRLFRINAKNPLLKEIKALVRKTVGAEALLKTMVNSLENVKAAFIYGSYAKHSMRPDSDIDLLVVVDDMRTEDKLVDELAKIEKMLQRDVNYKIYNENDFTMRLQNKDPFLSEVMFDEHIELKGNI